MGIDNFKTKSSNSREMYSQHDYDEKLELMLENLEKRFPVDLKIDFIEVSPRMTKTRAKAYKRDGNTYYIRISEEFIHDATDERIELTVLHEMCHVYAYVKGFSEINHNKFFRWIVGRVGASMTYSSVYSQEWIELIEPFLDDDKFEFESTTETDDFKELD
jgi:predicted SprT family Zn-dependent metalloprotease